MSRLIATFCLMIFSSAASAAYQLACRTTDESGSHDFIIDSTLSGDAWINRKLTVQAGEKTWTNLIVVHAYDEFITSAFLSDGETGVSAQWDAEGLPQKQTHLMLLKPSPTGPHLTLLCKIQ